MVEQAAKTSNRPLILGATLLATFLTAMEATVVSTAMPTIIGELRGLDLYAWVFSAYLLTSTATVPLYGRLADMVGRKPVMLTGIGLFLVGSALSGLSQNMPELIFFRALQGLGAGAVQPIVFTILGDLYTLKERARIQGLFSAIWGASSVAGPALGALITETIGWRWVFYINIPLGTVAALLIWRNLHEPGVRRQHALDYTGAAALTSGVAVLLWGLLGQQGGVNPPAIAVGVALLVAFALVELRAQEPVLPLGLFREPFIAVPCLAGLLTGGVQFSVSSYVPLFVQGVQLGTVGDAGKVLASVSVAWSVAGFLSPRLLIRFGFRPVALIGTALIVCGTALLTLYRQQTPAWFMVLNLLILGWGMGFSSNSFLLAAQNAVGWDRRGVVTASVQFSRTIGGTLGIAVFGAVLNAHLTRALRAVGASDANAVLNPAVRSSIPPTVLQAVQQGLAAALHQVYLLLALTALAGFVVATFFPGGTAATAPARTPEKGPAEPIGTEAERPAG